MLVALRQINIIFLQRRYQNRPPHLDEMKNEPRAEVLDRPQGYKGISMTSLTK